MLDEMLLAGELQEPSKKVPDPFCFCFSLVASCHCKICAHSCVSHAVFLLALVPTAVPICMFVLCRLSSKATSQNRQYNLLDVNVDREREREDENPKANITHCCYQRQAAFVARDILPKEVECNVQAITRVIEAQDQLVESAKLGTDKPTAAKS